MRKVCTCIAQANETSALAIRFHSCGKKPTTNSITISHSTTSCRQWSRCRFCSFWCISSAALKKSLYYWGIILLFALGAGLGSLALDLCGAKAIWFSCLLLTVSFCLMFLKEDVEEIKEDLEALEAKH